MSRLIALVGQHHRMVPMRDLETGAIITDPDGNVVEEIDHEFESRRYVAMYGFDFTVPGKGHRADEGYSKTYVFGPQPGTYVLEMTDDDAAKLLASRFGINFKDVTDEPPGFEQRTFRPADEFFSDVENQVINRA